MGKITKEDLSKRTEFSKKLSKLDDFIVWSHVAMEYFRQSPAWMVYKMIGKNDKGEPTDFTKNEKLILKGALVDMADILRRTADEI